MAIESKKIPRHQIEGRKGCFASGTLVQTPSGPRPIEDIQVGETVISFLDDGSLSEGIVKQTLRHENEQVVRYRIWGIDDLRATPNHWVLNQFNAFVEIGSLGHNDGIVDKNGHLRTIVSSEEEATETVYNLEVLPWHTFIANDLRVHNGGRGLGAYQEYIEGEKGGGKGGGGASRVAKEAPNTLRSKSTARVIDLISEGEIGGLVDGAKSIFLDDTPLQNDDDSYNFEGVDWDTREGLPDQDYFKGIPGSESEVVVGVEVTNAQPVIRSVTDPDLDAARVTVRFSSGLTYQESSTGDLKGTKVALAIDIRENGGSFVEVLSDTVDGKTTSPYERSYRVDLPAGGAPWDIRVRRVTGDREKSNYNDSFYFARYTEIIDDKFIYPDCALVGLAVDSELFGGNIPARAYEIYGLKINVPSNYDPATRTYSGIWDGTFKYEYSNNPAWVLYDMLTNTRYGLGDFVDPALVDKWALYPIAQYCDELVDDGFGGQEPRFCFNGIINTREEAYRIVQTIASVFRGMTYWGPGVVSFSQDAPADHVKIVTPANVIDGDFIYSGTGTKAQHSVAVVSFNDPEDAYRLGVEVYEDADLVRRMGWVPKEVMAPFCTSRGQAHRVGKWIIDEEKNATDTVTYKTGMDHADVIPGQIIAVADPHIADVRYGGRLVNATATELTLDAPVDLQSGETYTVFATLPNGSLIESGITNGPGETNVLQLDQTLATIPKSGATWLLTGTDVAPRLFRVIANREESAHLFEITALQHDPNKYDRIEKDIYLEPNSHSAGPTGALTPPTDISTAEYLYQSGNQIRAGVTVSFSASTDVRVRYYEIQIKRPNESFKTVQVNGDLSADVLDVSEGIYRFRVRGIDFLGRNSAWVETNDIHLFATENPPADVQNFAISILDSQAHLTWDPVPDLDLSHYHVKFSPQTNGAAWSSSVDLVKRVGRDSTTVVVPAMVGTYLIKAADQSDPPVESVNATTIISNIAGLQNLNVVEVGSEHPTWAGAHDSTVVDNNTLRLAATNGVVDQQTGSYSIANVIDLGEVFTARISARLVAFGENFASVMSDWAKLSDVETLSGTTPSDWDVRVQIRTTEDDPLGTPTWSEWRDLAVGDYRVRAVDARLILTSNVNTVTPVVVEFDLTVDMPDRVAGAEDVVCPAGGMDITFNPAFRTKPALVIDAQGMAVDDEYVLSNKTENGFHIEFFDANGVSISRTFDWIAKGYGSKG